MHWSVSLCTGHFCLHSHPATFNTVTSAFTESGTARMEDVETATTGGKWEGIGGRMRRMGERVLGGRGGQERQD